MTVSIIRVSDRVLIADVEVGSRPDMYWLTTTGRRWTRIPASTVPPSPTGTIAGRRVSVVYPDAHGRASIALIGAGLTSRVLRQRGAGPVEPGGDDYFPQTAAGPTGVLVVSTDLRVWLGVPTTR